MVKEILIIKNSQNIMTTVVGWWFFVTLKQWLWRKSGVHGSPMLKTHSFESFNWISATRFPELIQFRRDPKCSALFEKDFLFLFHIYFFLVYVIYIQCPVLCSFIEITPTHGCVTRVRSRLAVHLFPGESLWGTASMSKEF